MRNSDILGWGTIFDFYCTLTPRDQSSSLPHHVNSAAPATRPEPGPAHLRLRSSSIRPVPASSQFCLGCPAPHHRAPEPAHEPSHLSLGLLSDCDQAKKALRAQLASGSIDAAQFKYARTTDCLTSTRSHDSYHSQQPRCTRRRALAADASLAVQSILLLRHHWELHAWCVSVACVLPGSNCTSSRVYAGS